MSLTLQAQRTQTGCKNSLKIENTVSEAQSLELAQIFIHGSLSCVAYLRDLFIESSFDDIIYEPSRTRLSYADYAASNEQTSGRNSKSGRNSRTGTRIAILKRGRNLATDTFMDWLEHGAFDALKRRVLRALQLKIFENPARATHVIECYTFSFDYSTRDNKCATDPGKVEISLRHSSGRVMSMKKAKYSLHLFIRQLIQLCKTFPSLPRKRFLGMQLFYTNDCDPAYNPNGFERCTETKYVFPRGSGWKRYVHKCGVYAAGFHNIALNVSYLDNEYFENAGDENEKGIAPERVIPANLAFCDKVDCDADVVKCFADEDKEVEGVNTTGCDSAWEDINRDTSSELTDERTLEESQQVPGLASSKTRGRSNELLTNGCKGEESTNDEHYNEAEEEEQINEESEKVDKSTPSQELAENGALAEDVQTKQALQKMLDLTRKMELGGGDTQPMVGSSQMASVGRDESRSMLDEIKEAGKKIRLSEKARQMIQGRRGTVAVKAASDESQNVISCQCGIQEDIDDMVCCDFCHQWEHITCYGYEGRDDVRLGVEHACYECLVGEESELLNELAGLALIRMSIRVIDQFGYPSDGAFRKLICSDVQTAAWVVRQLKAQNILIARSGKKTGANERSDKYYLNKSMEATRKKKELYFDPRVKLESLLIYANENGCESGDCKAKERNAGRDSDVQMSEGEEPCPREKSSWVQLPLEGQGNGSVENTDHSTKLEVQTQDPPSTPRNKVSLVSMKYEHCRRSGKRGSPVTSSSPTADNFNAKRRKLLISQTVNIIDAGGFSSPVSEYTRV